MECSCRNSFTHLFGDTNSKLLFALSNITEILQLEGLTITATTAGDINMNLAGKCCQHMLDFIHGLVEGIAQFRNTTVRSIKITKSGDEEATLIMKIEEAAA